MSESNLRGYVSSFWWALRGLFEVILSIFAVPLLILLVGLPLVLVVRLVIEIVQMLT